MKSLIRYKTKPETADENQRLVEKVYEELTAQDPGGVHYATLRLEDGVTFMHLFTTDTDDAGQHAGRDRRFFRVPAKSARALRRAPWCPARHRRRLVQDVWRLILRNDA